MKIEKVIVTAKSRKLDPKWTVEYSDEVMNIIGDELWKEMGEQTMDQEWYRVQVGGEPDYSAIYHWVRDNIRGVYMEFGRDYYFKSSSDSIMFSLRWS